MPYASPSESDPTTSNTLSIRPIATPDVENTQRLNNYGEGALWEPCYVCFERGGARSYSSLVIVKLLMHKIWMWENEMADEDYAKAEFEASPGSQGDPPERVPPEIELLPCHYFDLFYGASHGGIIAILLGRHRLRITDAGDLFQKIPEAGLILKGKLRPAVSLRRVLGVSCFEPKNLASAVHNAVSKQFINPTECGGADQPFRNPATWQAQTCVAIPVDSDASHQRLHLLDILIPTCRQPYNFRQSGKRSAQYCLDGAQRCLESAHHLLEGAQHFAKALYQRYRVPAPQPVRMKCGMGKRHDHPRRYLLDTFTPERPYNARSDFLSMFYNDRPDFTICQVCQAVTGSPRSVRQVETLRLAATLSKHWGGSSVTDDAVADYEKCCRLDAWRSDRPALFMSIGHNEEIPGSFFINPEYNQTASRLLLAGQIFAHLSPSLRDIESVEPGRTFDASTLRSIYETTVDAVDKDERLKMDLRRIARELVRRRRARQAMGGPRWK